MFIDEAEIGVRSGKGGNGMVHFRREEHYPCVYIVLSYNIADVNY